MLPSLTCFDRRDSPLMDSEGCANFFLCFPVGAANADLSDDLAGELGVWVAISELPPAGPVAMIDVLFAGQPSEVFQPVVGPVEVDVVGVLSGRWRADESPENHAVDHLCANGFPVFPERDVVVTGPSDTWLADSALLDLHASVDTANHAINRADSSESGSLIDSIVAGDRFPDFNCGRILLSHRRLLEGAWLELRQAFARPAARFVSEEFYHA